MHGLSGYPTSTAGSDRGRRHARRYFTARQAEQAGYVYPHLTYHVNRGNFERIRRGLYRIPTIPLSKHDDLIRLTLWSRGRDDVAQAVVSHESALSLHELSDMLPGKVHLTVPRSFRRNAPPECKLHKAELAPDDNAFRVTTPLRALTDVASENAVPTEQLVRAVRDALERGNEVASPAAVSTVYDSHGLRVMPDVSKESGPPGVSERP